MQYCYIGRVEATNERKALSSRESSSPVGSPSRLLTMNVLQAIRGRRALEQHIREYIEALQELDAGKSKD